jgi:hypothetical protein
MTQQTTPQISDLEEHKQQKRIEHTAVKSALAWSGWGSPVGLSVFVASIGFLLLCLHTAGIVH